MTEYQIEGMFVQFSYHIMSILCCRPEMSFAEKRQKQHRERSVDTWDLAVGKTVNKANKMTCSKQYRVVDLRQRGLILFAREEES